MNALDEMKKVIEETREELNKLVLTDDYASFFEREERSGE